VRFGHGQADEDVVPGSGGALDLDKGVSSIINSAIASNSSSYSSGGISSYDAYVYVINSILWGNGSAALDGAFEVTYSLIEGGYWGEGNISAAPLFVDLWGGDLHLQAGSPCIDAADGDTAPEHDLEDGHVAERDEGLGNGVGERPKPCPFPAREMMA
jgi:hypothetical protein